MDEQLKKLAELARQIEGLEVIEQGPSYEEPISPKKESYNRVKSLVSPKEYIKNLPNTIKVDPNFVPEPSTKYNTVYAGSGTEDPLNMAEVRDRVIKSETEKLRDQSIQDSTLDPNLNARRNVKKKLEEY